MFVSRLPAAMLVLNLVLYFSVWNHQVLVSQHVA